MVTSASRCKSSFTMMVNDTRGKGVVGWDGDLNTVPFDFVGDAPVGLYQPITYCKKYNSLPL
jgi:hypothetical protein